MILGPVSAGYPGKYVCYALAVFALAHLSFALKRTFEQIKGKRNRANLGVKVKPDVEKNPGAGIAILLIDCAVLVALISEIYQHRPN